MDAQTWQIISIVGYSLAGVLFFAAVIMFFKMDVWGIIGDLTGRTAAKQIQAIREQNTMSGNKRYKPSALNLERGTLTEPVGSRRLGRKSKHNAVPTKGLKKLAKRGHTQEAHSRPVITESLPTGVLQPESIIARHGTTDTFSTEMTVLVNQKNSHSDETTLLVNEVAAGAEATTVLTEGKASFGQQTTVLVDEKDTLIEENELLDQGTEVLSQEEKTTVLNPTEELENEENPRHKVIEFNMVKDIKITHTDKVI